MWALQSQRREEHVELATRQEAGLLTRENRGADVRLVAFVGQVSGVGARIVCVVSGVGGGALGDNGGGGGGGGVLRVTSTRRGYLIQVRNEKGSKTRRGPDHEQDSLHRGTSAQQCIEAFAFYREESHIPTTSVRNHGRFSSKITNHYFSYSQPTSASERWIRPGTGAAGHNGRIRPPRAPEEGGNTVRDRCW